MFAILSSVENRTDSSSFDCLNCCHLNCSFFSIVLHDNKLTHTDLKPENILFVNSDFTMSYNVEKVRCFQMHQMVGNLYPDTFGNSVSV